MSAQSKLPIDGDWRNQSKDAPARPIRGFLSLSFDARIGWIAVLGRGAFTKFIGYGSKRITADVPGLLCSAGSSLKRMIGEPPRL